MLNENSNLGSKLKDSRKKLGLSQEALAEKANVSLSTIQRIEKGTVKPRSFTVKILAETLNLNTEELLSHLLKNNVDESSIFALKRMNLFTLLLVFIPFINLVIPFIYWKKSKKIHNKETIAGKLMSFQLLWSIFTIILMLISIFLTNLIVGEAGIGLYIMNTIYLLAVVFNVVTIVKTSSQLNNEEKKVLTYIPNLF